jgi:hypothetical protein
VGGGFCGAENDYKTKPNISDDVGDFTCMGKELGLSWKLLIIFTSRD